MCCARARAFVVVRGNSASDCGFLLAIASHGVRVSSIDGGGQQLRNWNWNGHWLLLRRSRRRQRSVDNDDKVGAGHHVNARRRSLPRRIRIPIQTAIAIQISIPIRISISVPIQHSVEQALAIALDKRLINRQQIPLLWRRLQTASLVLKYIVRAVHTALDHATIRIRIITSIIAGMNTIIIIVHTVCIIAALVASGRSGRDHQDGTAFDEQTRPSRRHVEALGRRSHAQHLRI